jgi:hypothetical protein
MGAVPAGQLVDQSSFGETKLMKCKNDEVPLLRKRPDQARLFLAGLFVTVAMTPFAASGQVGLDELGSALSVINQIEPNGIGHEKAVAAIKILNSATPQQVPALLAGMDGGNKLAQNWIRGAIQSALDGSSTMPAEALRAFLDDSTKGEMGRLMAYELLVEHSPELSDELLPQFFDDPCLPLRELSIAWLIDQAEKGDKYESSAKFLVALVSARKVEQIQDIAARLKKRGVEIDLQRTLGFINEWKLAGPFDNRNEEGFARPAGPEIDTAAIDVAATYSDSLDGSPVKWTTRRTVDPMGVVNLIDVYGKLKGVSVYAYAEFEAADEVDCELRIGCINASRVWLNGQEIMSNEIYHVGMMPDQFSAAGKLIKGTNRILVKICQNEQEEPWAQDWMFQLRVCHPDGSAVKPDIPVAPEQ